MSHELVPTAPTADLHTQMEFAEKLAAASLLPRAYQRQPANVLLAMQLGGSRRTHAGHSSPSTAPAHRRGAS